tara:strand:- start:789 stop:2834 length:2046 start_codon:yes stop_codon:yes gene_type:complete
MTSPRLHPRTIESVKERADIVDVVGEHVVLKKKGREFVGICPFHDDSKPSMTVSPAKQFYYCFSCGAGGNSIKFLMEFNRQSFGEVVLELARKYQLPIETIDGNQQEKFRKQLSLREELYRINSLASSWFSSQLKDSEGKYANEYLLSERGLSMGTIEEFSLGFAPDKWDGLYKYLNLVENIPSEFIEKAGLIVAKRGGSGFYDRFRNRIIVPISDRQGRIIGFGGRSLDDSLPKYLNSPETEIFEKGHHLYGLDKSIPYIRKEDLAVVVEGYFDVITLHSSGINNAVASLGTALSNKQITQLSRCTDSKRIILNFDADKAGVNAANRAIVEVEQLALQGQIDLRVLHLPSGKDPDEFLKEHGSGEYKALLDKSPVWLDWQIDELLKGLDLTKADQFQIAVTGLVQLLGKLPQSAVRTHYLQKVSERLSGGQARLAIQLEEDLRRQVKGQRWHGRSKRLDLPGEASQRERSEAEVLRLYLHCPEFRSEIRRELHKRDLEDFAIHHHRLLWSAICELEESNLSVGRLESINRGDDKGLDLSNIDLPQLLGHKFILESNDLSIRLMPLIHPSEVQLLSMSEPRLHLRGCTALLEKQKSLKRSRHLLESWSGQRLETLEKCIASLIEEENNNPSEENNMDIKIEKMFLDLNKDALAFQHLYYSERKHILNLDQQRCSGYEKDFN